MISRGTKLAAPLAVLFLLASASITQAAFDKPVRKCRETVAKDGRKLADTVARTLSSCHKKRSSGSTQVPASTDCNSIAEADTRNKIGKTADKLRKKVADKCSGFDPQADLLYASDCPAPCEGIGPINDQVDIANCIVCIIESSGEDMSFNAEGLPAVPLASDNRKCHDAIGKNQTKHFSTVVKERAKCQKKGEAHGATTVDDCSGSDPKGKIAKVRSKAESKVASACANADLMVIDACTNLGVEALKACVFDDSETRGEGIFKALYTLLGLTTPPTTTSTTSGGTTTTVTTTTVTTTTTVPLVQDPQCPATGELVLLAGYGGTCTTNGDCLAGVCDGVSGRCKTATKLDTGWTGLGQNADINDMVVTKGNLLCPGPFDGGSSEPCGECQVTGINPDPGYCRCANDTRQICDEPFVADNNDCGGAICNCYFGAPLPLSAGNVPACAVNRFAQDIYGTANVDLGSGQISASLRSIVYLGESIVDPCPYCTGDTTPDDGSRDGTCVHGANAGNSCDASAYNDTFPGREPPATSGDGYSLDCFPSIGLNVSGAGLKIVLDQTTGSSSLDSNVLCGYPEPPLNLFLSCQCGVCGNDASDGSPCNTNGDCATCTSNADCDNGGSGDGICDGSGHCECVRRANLDPLPNQCAVDAVCNDVGGDVGECNQGPNDKFCDAIIRASGAGYIQCNSNADCDAGAIGINAGNCTLTTARQCFLPTINATGTADPSFPIGAATFCVPPTGNGGINGAAGLPGPGRVINQAASTLYCASDPGTVYVPGSGGCP
jgi:hypothetical protein